MSIVETLLVFVGIPFAIYAVIAVLVMARGTPRAARYRPGREWTHEPVWYLPRPVATAAHSGAPELPAGPAGAGGGSTAAPNRTARGGASGTW